MKKNQCLNCGRKNQYNEPYLYGVCSIGECRNAYHRERMRERRAIPENREKRNAQKRELIADPEKRAEYNARMRETMREWLAIPENREKRNAQKRARNKERYHSDPEYRAKKIKESTERQKPRGWYLEIGYRDGVIRSRCCDKRSHLCGEFWCYLCRLWLPMSIMEVEHIKPRSTHPELAFVKSNLRLACKPCNTAKSNKPLKVVLKERTYA